MRIVVIEAEAHVRAALTFMLEQQPDLQVLCAVGPVPDLVTRILAVRPDVILLDWKLPRRLARQILVAVRRSAEPSRIVVLSTRQEDEATARAAGADAFISKDQAPALLIRAIHTAAEPAGPLA